MPDDFNYSGRKSGDSKPYTGYAYQDITVSGGTDYSLKTYTTLFDTVTTPVKLTITNGGTAIGIKLNSATNDLINIAANAERIVESFAVTDIYVTASGSATFGVFALGWR
jgi:hypothetical protein